MVKYSVIGFRKFHSSKSNKDFTCIYTTYQADGIQGSACEELFCEDSRISGEVKLGSKVVPMYQKNSNYIDSLQVL